MKPPPPTHIIQFDRTDGSFFVTRVQIVQSTIHFLAGQPVTISGIQIANDNKTE